MTIDGVNVVMLFTDSGCFPTELHRTLGGIQGRAALRQSSPLGAAPLHSVSSLQCYEACLEVMVIPFGIAGASGIARLEDGAGLYQVVANFPSNRVM
jgi:hypothetical protein